MDSLLRVQEDTYKKLSRGLINFKKTPKERKTNNYIETRLESLEKQWSSFESMHQQLISEFSTDEFEKSEYHLKNKYETAEEFYIEYKVELKECLSNLNNIPAMKGTSGVFQDVNDPIRVQLPKISIPSFSGKYSEWMTFRDLFLSLIHNNKALQDVQKLHYLKSYLTGEAEQLLRHLPVTNDNYVNCWNLLEHRFNNKKYITNCILKRFFSQKNIVSESSTSLKDLFDTTNECLNALINVGINIDNWDVIIIYILSSKLDNESRKQWEAKICNLTNELPNLNEFLSFLELRFRSLEFLTNKIVKPTHSHHVSVDDTANKSVACIFCSELCHKLGNCKKFAKGDLKTRRDFVQNSGLCFNCLGANHSVIACRLPTRCRICKRKHHSLLHSNNLNSSTDTTGTNKQSVDSKDVVANVATTSQDGTVLENITTCFINNKIQVLLATALVTAKCNNGSYMTIRSLLDQGSQASFITEAAVQLLGLQKIRSNMVISGVGDEGNSSLNSKHVVYVKLQSIHDPTFTIRVKAHVLNKLTSFLPEKEFVVPWWPNLPKMKLADTEFNVPNKIDMLLGSEVYCQIITEGLMKNPTGTLLAQNTKLGWILSGKIASDKRVNHSPRSNTLVVMHTQLHNDDFDLKKFWELESDSFSFFQNNLTPEEQMCENHFEKTVTRDSSGRYIVKLPFKNLELICDKGNSLEIATNRFLMLEKRLSKSPKFKEQYSEVILEYLRLGHMEVIPKHLKNKAKSLYLPHHAVVRPDKITTSLRVVFDASSRDNNGVSLNDELMVGPKLQFDLRHIVMRWRLYPICLTADIVKMYRQIRVADDDIDYQRLLWRTDPTEDIQHLRLTRVTFGTASAPYLAVKALHQVARDDGEQLSLASERVLRDFYMDDLLTGCQTVSEGKQIYEQMRKLLGNGGFELQKWSSNDEVLLHEISTNEKATDNNRVLKTDEIIKILGLTWNRRSDCFEYTVQLPPISEPVTKRKVISDIAKLFDPMGWIAPVITKAKIMIQRLWLTGITWDQELPSKLLNDWIAYRSELIGLTKFRLPRWVSTTHENSLELHGFCDASSEAYAAVVYARLTNEIGPVHVHLLTSKTKVAPVKQVSIPRLELCGAVLLAKLLQEVSAVLDVPKFKLHAWTDSTVVLAWLSSHPSRWKTFIANRVSEILTITERHQWAHVSTKENPADYASRGVNPSECSEIQMWKTGPIWLKDKIIHYNSNKISDTNLEEKSKRVCYLTKEPQLEFWCKFSSLQKLIRVVAYCKRFICKMKRLPLTLPEWLSSKEINEALFMCIKQCQATSFLQELHDIKTKGNVDRKSKLMSLNPFCDKEGVLRVGGRLDRAEISNDMKHPIILPARSYFTGLIIADAHVKTLHGGPQLMVNYIRSKYWVINAKNQAKMFVRKCVTCVRYGARTREQLMGQLPTARVTPIRTFYQSGVDYAGPIWIRASKGRGRCSYKGYICLFVCMATRAIHLEAVSDLTSQGFLAAFKRFVARRGHCADLYSDNGTNFVGAARELKMLFTQEKSTVTREIAECLADNGTTWHFIPPHAPHFGGLWEAGIKSTKHHLKRVIGNAILTFEEISTLLYQIEACLNSRPLSQVNINSQDQFPLTPGHFLIGEPTMLVPEYNYANTNISSLKRWQLTQKLLQHFWHRWSKEYLSQFLHRYKWAKKTPEPNIGDIVLVKEDDLPPAKWLMGVIVDKHPGLDNITRVVSLKCKDVILKRPITKLCILPVAC